MPQRNREQEIITAIREHLKVAKTGSERITDQSLMTVVNCKRATFYKYVKKGSKIRSEIKDAQIEQRKNPDAPERGTQQRDSKHVMAELRAELAQVKEANRGLLADYAQLIDNLKSKMVSDELIQWAQTTPIKKPDRSVSHAGRSRRRKR